MGVTVIGIEDTIGGAVGKFGEVLGDALDRTIFRKGLKEKEFGKSPEVMQGLIFAAKAAELRGPESLVAFAEGLDVTEDWVTDPLLAGFSMNAAQTT